MKIFNFNYSAERFSSARKAHFVERLTSWKGSVSLGAWRSYGLYKDGMVDCLEVLNG